MATQTSRPLRADAQRNRDAILSAALAIFDAEGINAPIDCIATTAGVGNATLYRNFPTRNDLLAAVIEKSIVEIIDSSSRMSRICQRTTRCANGFNASRGNSASGTTCQPASPRRSRTTHHRCKTSPRA